MKNFLKIFPLLFLPMFALEGLSQVPIDEEDPYFLLMGEADQAIKDEDYATAILRLKEAMQVDPTRPSNSLLLSNLGMVYSRMGQDSLAIVTLSRALELAPGMSVVLANRGRLHLKQGHNVDAYRDFSAAIDRDSLCLDARYYRGIMSLYSGKADIAEADFAVLASTDPEGYNTLAALGALYSLTRRDREAIPYYKKLLETDPAAEYYAALAGCYLAIGELSPASETIATGLKLYPSDPELYYYRAMLNRDLYLLDQAKSDAAQAIRLGARPDRVKALFDR